MAAEWYYTSNKQQMGPVSWEELQQLATRGLLKPNDLVWTSGMPDWVKAQQQSGLMQVAISPAPAKPRESAKPVANEFIAVEGGDETPASEPKKKKRRLDLDQDDDDDDRPVRRPKKSSGTSTTTYLLIGGGVLMLLLLVACGGIVFFVATSSDFGPDGVQNDGNKTTFTINNIRAKAQVERFVNLQAGKECDVVLTSRTFMKADVDVAVFDGQIGNRILAIDDSIGPNGRVVFRVPETKQYRVVIINHGPGNASSSVVVTQR